MVKKALLVGINKYSDQPLRGCINDVNNMKQLLLDTFDFSPENIRIVLDQEATNYAIRNGLYWLAGATSTNDVCIFYYAGRGHFVTDVNGDEADGGEAAIVPYDYQLNGYVIDDALRIIYDTFAKSCHLVTVMDSCFFGVNNRHPGEGRLYRFLPVTYEERRTIAEAKRKFHDIKRAIVSKYTQNLRERHMEYDEFQSHVRKIIDSFENNQVDDYRIEKRSILLTSCQRSQSSAEAQFDGSYEGAFTHFLIKAIRDYKGLITYGDLIQKVCSALKTNDFEQIPQLRFNIDENNCYVFSVDRAIPS